jgi:hypothetical protein
MAAHRHSGTSRSLLRGPTATLGAAVSPTPELSALTVRNLFTENGNETATSTDVIFPPRRVRDPENP